jgi:alpha-L-rhamnosidase
MDRLYKDGTHDSPFTGFRYAQIDGWPNGTPLTKYSIKAIAVRSDMEQTVWVSCSHAVVNKFHENVRWSTKGNFLSTSTDCSRDERLGWTGDTHSFGPTANFLYNIAGF